MMHDWLCDESCFQFHGMVEKGHEARVMMMLNNSVVMHMYDKDYSGNNDRLITLMFNKTQMHISDLPCLDSQS